MRPRSGWRQGLSKDSGEPLDPRRLQRPSGVQPLGERLAIEQRLAPG